MIIERNYAALVHGTHPFSLSPPVATKHDPTPPAQTPLGIPRAVRSAVHVSPEQLSQTMRRPLGQAAATRLLDDTTATDVSGLASGLRSNESGDSVRGQSRRMDLEERADTDKISCVFGSFPEGRRSRPIRTLAKLPSHPVSTFLLIFGTGGEEKWGCVSRIPH